MDALEKRVTKCKRDFDAELVIVRDGMTHLGSEVSALRGDVHSMTSSISSINTSLSEIAGTLKQLADLPEAWTALKGFWSVMRFLRENAILLVVTGAVVAYSIKTLTNA